jgi:hypothetical protein
MGGQTALNVIGITPRRPSDEDFLQAKRIVVLPITLGRCGRAYSGQ